MLIRACSIQVMIRLAVVEKSFENVEMESITMSVLALRSPILYVTRNKITPSVMW